MFASFWKRCWHCNIVFFCSFFAEMPDTTMFFYQFLEKNTDTTMFFANYWRRILTLQCFFVAIGGKCWPYNALSCLKNTTLSFTFNILSSPKIVASFDISFASTVITSPNDGIEADGPKCASLLVLWNSWSTNCLILLSYKSPSKFPSVCGVVTKDIPLGHTLSPQSLFVHPPKHSHIFFVISVEVHDEMLLASS